MENKAKIRLCKPETNVNGIIYYAGYVNGVRVHFLGFDKLTKEEQKQKLLEHYIREGHIL